MNYEINKEIVFSTAHINVLESAALQDKCSRVNKYIICYPYEYGWRIYTPPDFEETISALENFGVTNVARLLRIAKDNDCKWLVLDADGPLHEELPQYDW
jgi:hypothetical protein